MTKINNIIAYSRDITITDEDYVIGSDGDTSNKETKNYFFNDIRSYLLAGLAPEVGGTLKVTEINYVGELTSPSEVANALDPIYNVLQYNVVILSVNGDKYLLGLQNISIGVDQTPITDNDFIILNANEKLGDGTNLYKGTNEITGKEEHYALKSVGLSLTKETSGPNETGNVLVEQTEQTNLGNGVKVYKQFNTTTKLQEFYTLSSPSMDIAIVDDEVIFTIPTNSDTPSYIVNSDYEGDDETGSVIKPFKNLQNALTAYQGTGTNLIPQFVNDGVIIDVQKDENVFIGNLAYDKVNILLRKGVIINATPSYGDHYLDVDSDAILPPSMSVFSNTSPCMVTITLEEGAGIISTKKCIKTRGTNLNTNNGIAKVINLLGDGYLTISDDSSVASASVRNILDINSDNQAGFYNDGDLAHINLQCNIYSNNTQVFKVGLNGKLNSRDNSISFGNGVVDFNVLTKPFENNGGIIDSDGTDFINIKKGATLTNVVHTMSNGASFYAKNSQLGRDCEYLFENVGSTQPLLSLSNCTDVSDINTSIAKSTSVLWVNNDINGCNINGKINVSEFKISAPSSNIISNQLVESLETYINKETAITAGLFKGCKYIKRTVVTAGSFVVGEDYEIVTIGSTDFTLIGASANTVGIIFTATGIGTGTGTANFDKLDII